MHVHSLNNALVSLSPSEIDTIIDGLQISWHEWNIREAGVLLSHFEQLKSNLTKQITDISNDSI